MKNGSHLRLLESRASRDGDRTELPGSGAVPYVEPTTELLYERYAGYVGALASRMLGRASEVEDVVQEVFAASITGLRRRDNDLEVRGWLAKVTVRRCIRQLRLRRLWAVVDLAAEPSYDRLPARGASPDERLLIVQVYRALDRIPAQLRVAWTLHHVQGERLEQVAALCGCSLATVKRRIAAAHAKLTRALEPPSTRDDAHRNARERSLASEQPRGRHG
jgi:RNA polymerase sigma-70 factor, ECF subfamily